MDQLTYIKRFVATSPGKIRQEATMQKRAWTFGLAPNVRKVTRNSIVSDHLNEMCLADKYGDSIECIPEWIRIEITEILWKLYNDCGIEYIDVTPYNFIEKDDKVWIIDFGHAREPGGELDSYLKSIFDNWELTEWNKCFE